jgi:hypothetical protein
MTPSEFRKTEKFTQLSKEVQDLSSKLDRIMEEVSEIVDKDYFPYITKTGKIGFYPKSVGDKRNEQTK